MEDEDHRVDGWEEEEGDDLVDEPPGGEPPLHGALPGAVQSRGGDTDVNSIDVEDADTGRASTWAA